MRKIINGEKDRELEKMQKNREKYSKMSEADIVRDVYTRAPKQIKLD